MIVHPEGTILVVWPLERTHDYDLIPAISEPLVSPGVGVGVVRIRSCRELSGVVWSHLKLSRVVRSCPESSRVVWSVFWGQRSCTKGYTPQHPASMQFLAKVS